MADFSILWLRVASALYLLGVVHSAIVLLRRSNNLFPYAFGAFAAGLVVHLVSIVERGIATHQLPLSQFFETASACGFLTGLVFVLIYWRYRFADLAVGIFPLVFFLTHAASLESPVTTWTSSGVRSAWLGTHVLLILLAYASMLITALASLFYLVQERSLKSKHGSKPGAAPVVSSWANRLPPLGTLDSLVSRSMAIGFVFITLGVVAGSTWAFIESGTKWIGEERVAFAFLTWAAYLVMVFLRGTAGWRGRKAAVMSLVVLGFSAATWVAHVGLQPLLTGPGAPR